MFVNREAALVKAETFLMLYMQVSFHNETAGQSLGNPGRQQWPMRMDTDIFLK
jgi:hypothetical protein